MPRGIYKRVKKIVLTKEHRKKLSDALIGKKFTPERCKNISLSLKNNPRVSESALKRVFTKSNPCLNTKPELEMVTILNNLGIKYIHPFPVWKIKHRYNADFYIPSLNLIIEVDGQYWHNYPNGQEIDHIRTKELKEAGYKVLRFWENRKNILGFNKEMVEKSIEGLNEIVIRTN